MGKHSLEKHNELIRRGMVRAEQLEGKLARLIEPVLVHAGREAARNFEALATNHLAADARMRDRLALMSVRPTEVAAFLHSLSLCAAAGGVKPSSTMIAVKPRNIEAQALAQPGGMPPEELHVTLVFLGEVEGDLTPVLDAIRTVAGTHAPLTGKIAGQGQFVDDQGNPVVDILLPDVPGLVELRVAITNALVQAGIAYSRDHGFLAHTTVTWEPTGETFDVAGTDLHFDQVLVVRGDEEVHELPLTGSPPLTAAGQPGWSAPAPNEVLNVDPLVKSLRTKTDPVRLAVISNVAKSTVEGAGIEWDVNNPYVADVLEHTGEQIVNIAKTTQTNVMNTIASSYDQGLSIPDTAKVIQAGMKEASGARAILIARTEMTGAVNGGSLAATKMVADVFAGAGGDGDGGGGGGGGGFSKVWMTAPGAPFPRHETYEGLDGQTTSLEGVFTVGEDQLQYPGDPSGSPDEVCNCRCALSYVNTAGEEVGSADTDTAGFVPDLGDGGDEGGGGGGLGGLAEDAAAAAPVEGEGGLVAYSTPDQTAAIAAPETRAETLPAEPKAAESHDPLRPFKDFNDNVLGKEIWRARDGMKKLLAKDAMTVKEQERYGNHEKRLQGLLSERAARKGLPPPTDLGVSPEERAVAKSVTDVQPGNVHVEALRDAYNNRWRPPDPSLVANLSRVGTSMADTAYYIDDAFGYSAGLSDSIKVFRGTGQGEIPDAIDKGGMLNYKTYLSTTTERAIADDFAGGSDVLEITVPNGNKAIWMPAAADTPQAAREMEVLLQRDSRLVVTKVEERAEGGRTIHATVWSSSDQMPSLSHALETKVGADAEKVLEDANKYKQWGRYQHALRYYSSIDGHGELNDYLANDGRIALSPYNTRNGPWTSDAKAFIADVQATGQHFVEEVQARMEAKGYSGHPLSLTATTRRREAITEVLSEVRDVGKTGARNNFANTTGSAEVRKLVEAGTQFYPRDWLMTAKDAPINFKKVGRGYYGGNVLAVSERYGAVRADGNGFPVAVHEMGHLMEQYIPGVKAAEAAFYEKRVAGQELRTYRRGDPLKNEVTRPDEFVDEYIGKDYNYEWQASENLTDTGKLTPEAREASREIMPGATDSFELLSMGMEGLFTGSFDIWKDKDMTSFILGLLVHL